MNVERDQKTEKILDLTLEIIHLLTGEGHVVVKKPSEHVEHSGDLHASVGSHSPITEPPPRSPTLQRKILGLTHTILCLLTGEVPIRCEDVTIHLSMEEWEYLEEHKGLYNDMMAENHYSCCALEDKCLPGTSINEISSSDFQSENESGKKTLTGGKCQKTSQPLEGETVIDMSEKSVALAYHFTPTCPIATDYACTPVKEHSASCTGGNLSYSLLYAPPAHTQTESPLNHIKEEAAVCKGSFTETHDYCVLDPPMVEDAHSEEDTDCCSRSLGANPITFSTESRNLEEVNTPSGKSSQSIQDPEAKSYYPGCPENMYRDNMGHLELGKVIFPCLESGRCPSFMQNLISHQKIHTRENVFKCTECGKCFNRKGNLVVHQRIHTGEKPFMCAECGKCFKQLAHLTTHQRKEPFKCEENEKYFTQNSILDSQKPIDTGEQPLICNECGDFFHLKSSLVLHQRIHAAEKPFKCDECGECFKQASNLITHRSVHTGEKTFKCTECEKCFLQKDMLISHQSLHTGERPFKCSECGKCFSHNHYLILHQRIHTGENTFKCTECGKCFIRKDILISHQQIHKEEKPFTCSECGICFRFNYMLSSHKTVHTGEKPFKCSECGKCFRLKNNLGSHLRSHAGVKPFNCRDCGKYFSSVTHLTAHQRVHTGEKPFRCSECGKCFHLKKGLRLHQRIHTGEKTFSV